MKLQKTLSDMAYNDVLSIHINPWPLKVHKNNLSFPCLKRDHLLSFILAKCDADCQPVTYLMPHFGSLTEKEAMNLLSYEHYNSINSHFYILTCDHWCRQVVRTDDSSVKSPSSDENQFIRLPVNVVNFDCNRQLASPTAINQDLFIKIRSDCCYNSVVSGELYKKFGFFIRTLSIDYHYKIHFTLYKASLLSENISLSICTSIVIVLGLPENQKPSISKSKYFASSTDSSPMGNLSNTAKLSTQTSLSVRMQRVEKNFSLTWQFILLREQYMFDKFNENFISNHLHAGKSFLDLFCNAEKSLNLILDIKPPTNTSTLQNTNIMLSINEIKHSKYEISKSILKDVHEASKSSDKLANCCLLLRVYVNLAYLHFYCDSPDLAETSINTAGNFHKKIYSPWDLGRTHLLLCFDSLIKAVTTEGVSVELLKKCLYHLDLILATREVDFNTDVMFSNFNVVKPDSSAGCGKSAPQTKTTEKFPNQPSGKTIFENYQYHTLLFDLCQSASILRQIVLCIFQILLVKEAENHVFSDVVSSFTEFALGKMLTVSPDFNKAVYEMEKRFEEEIQQPKISSLLLPSTQSLWKIFTLFKVLRDLCLKYNLPISSSNTSPPSSMIVEFHTMNKGDVKERFLLPALNNGMKFEIIRAELFQLFVSIMSSLPYVDRYIRWFWLEKVYIKLQEWFLNFVGKVEIDCMDRRSQSDTCCESSGDLLDTDLKSHENFADDELSSSE